MFFRVDSVTLNTPYISEKSDKIIFRSTKIIGTYLGLSEGEKSDQNQPDYLVVCTRGVLTFVANGLDINGCVLANLCCYTSCTLTTLHCSKV